MAELGHSKTNRIFIGIGDGFQIGKSGWFLVGISAGFHRNP
ncbi:hypothetical protein [Methylobacter sp.]|nr:hypothetical protein [Methylobacter sp.]